jgi:NAD(P)-dependent dehydrogenase (short-subunit alcohol dehydrogenase family)
LCRRVHRVDANTHDIERLVTYFNPLSLTGQRALVTGGSKGAGAAIVERLAAAGAAVTAVARNEPAKTVAEHFVVADIATVHGVQAITTHVRALGGVQILVHVAGGSSAPAGGFATLTEDDWLDELQLNLLGAVRLDRALAPAMLEAGAGPSCMSDRLGRASRSTTARWATAPRRPRCALQQGAGE